MSDILCVTNRKLCREDFFVRIEKIAKEKPKGIILREKDVSAKEYKKMAEQVMTICKKHRIPCILHNFAEVAKELDSTALHLPLPVLRTLDETDKSRFTILGTSCHSLEDAKEAEQLGCTYILAGHIFATDCKKGLPGRGLEFLQNICQSVSVPVYAIGGIDAQNVRQVRNAGASGACVMSSMMRCENPGQYHTALMN